MAYMSDIDLATLHKTRLEEKVNYKLSWLAQQKPQTSHTSIDYSVARSKTYNTHRKLTRAVTDNRCNTAAASPLAATANNGKTCRGGQSDSNLLLAKKKSGAGKQQVVEHSGNKEPECDIYVKNIEKELMMRDSVVGIDLVDNLSDDGYFSSETRRRRSGTWP